MTNKKNFSGSHISIKEDLTKKRYAVYQYIANKIGFRNVWSIDGNVKAKFQDKVWSVKSIAAFDDITTMKSSGGASED